MSLHLLKLQFVVDSLKGICWKNVKQLALRTPTKDCFTKEDRKTLRCDQASRLLMLLGMAFSEIAEKFSEEFQTL